MEESSGVMFRERVMAFSLEVENVEVMFDLAVNRKSKLSDAGVTSVRDKPKISYCTTSL